MPGQKVSFRVLKERVHLLDPGVIPKAVVLSLLGIVTGAILDKFPAAHPITEPLNRFQELRIIVVGKLAFQVCGTRRGEKVHELQALFVAEAGQKPLDDLGELVSGEPAQLLSE